MNGLDEPVLGSAATAHRAAAAVEKADMHAGVTSGSRERRLGAVHRPQAGEDPAVLVAVAVPDHHLLYSFARSALATLNVEAARRHRMPKERAQDLRAALEIVNR